MQPVVCAHICSWSASVFLQLLTSRVLYPLAKMFNVSCLCTTPKKAPIFHFYAQTRMHSVSFCTLQWCFIAKLRATQLHFTPRSLSPLSRCLPSLPHRTKTLVYSTHEATSLLNIYFSSLSLYLWKKWVLLHVFVCFCVCSAMCFFSTGKWLLNSVQTMINGSSEPDG